MGPESGAFPGARGVRPEPVPLRNGPGFVFAVPFSCTGDSVTRYWKNVIAEHLMPTAVDRQSPEQHWLLVVQVAPGFPHERPSGKEQRPLAELKVQQPG